MTPDDELLAKAKQLDPEAIKALHQRYYGPIARYVQLKVSHPQLAEDLVGEVFIRILDGLRRNRGWKTSPQGWVMGIARHVVADHYRHQERHQEVGLTDNLSADDMPLLHHVAQSERERVLQDALHHLTDAQRDVIILRFMAGLDIKSVANAMNKTPGAIKALQHRALKILAAEVSQLKFTENE